MEIIRERKTKELTKEKKFFVENYKKGEEINVSLTAKSLGVSRRCIYNWINEIKNK